MNYRYYSKLRPIMPGGYPSNHKPVEIKNFDCRIHCDEIGTGAWGWIEFAEKLTEEEASGYELILAKEPDIDRLKVILTNAIDIIFEHESGDVSRYENVSEFWGWLFAELGTNITEMLALGIDLSDYEPEGGFRKDG